MNSKAIGWLLACLCLFLAASVPAQGQTTTTCTASPDAAVRCFVRNAVYAGMASVPAGMTLTQYKAYGVSVSNIVQNPPTLVFVLGMMGAVSDALPGINADGGTPNAAAQDAAISAIIDAALNDGLIALPAETTADQLKMFAHDVCGAMAANAGVTISPGALLRFLDSYLVTAMAADGTVVWPQVQAGISSFVDGLVNSGLVNLPAGLTSDNVKSFAYDVTLAIQGYKDTTGRIQLLSRVRSVSSPAARLLVTAGTVFKWRKLTARGAFRVRGSRDNVV